MHDTVKADRWMQIVRTKDFSVAKRWDMGLELEEDIPIWENKAYLERPALCDGDAPIGRFRRWARQFYADSTQTEVDEYDA